MTPPTALPLSPLSDEASANAGSAFEEQVWAVLDERPDAPWTAVAQRLEGDETARSSYCEMVSLHCALIDYFDPRDGVVGGGEAGGTLDPPSNFTS